MGGGGGGAVIYILAISGIYGIKFSEFKKEGIFRRYFVSGLCSKEN